MEEIDCKYVVLNRLKMKKCPELGFGELQTVEIFSTPNDIVDAMTLVAETLRDIHINKVFLKSKCISKQNNCFFCPYKTNPTLCNNNPEQYKYFLDEYQDRRKLLAKGEYLDPVFA